MESKDPQPESEEEEEGSSSSSEEEESSEEESSSSEDERRARKRKRRYVCVFLCVKYAPIIYTCIFNKSLVLLPPPSASLYVGRIDLYSSVVSL